MTAKVVVNNKVEGISITAELDQIQESELKPSKAVQNKFVNSFYQCHAIENSSSVVRKGIRKALFGKCLRKEIFGAMELSSFRKTFSFGP